MDKVCEQASSPKELGKYPVARSCWEMNMSVWIWVILEVMCAWSGKHHSDNTSPCQNDKTWILLIHTDNCIPLHGCHAGDWIPSCESEYDKAAWITVIIVLHFDRWNYYFQLNPVSDGNGWVTDEEISDYFKKMASFIVILYGSGW